MFNKIEKLQDVPAKPVSEKDWSCIAPRSSGAHIGEFEVRSESPAESAREAIRRCLVNHKRRKFPAQLLRNLTEDLDRQPGITTQARKNCHQSRIAAR